LIDVFSCLQDDAEFGHTVDFLDSDFGADFTYGKCIWFQFH
jgi:hypothetical protein